MDPPLTIFVNAEVPSSDDSHVTTPLQLSYNALIGIPTRIFIHFSGHVNGRQIRILMDDGSLDNFIDPYLVQRLVIPSYRIPQFQVQVGSGELLQCDGEVLNLLVKIQNHILSVYVVVLPISRRNCFWVIFCLRL